MLDQRAASQVLKTVSRSLGKLLNAVPKATKQVCNTAENRLFNNGPKITNLCQGIILTYVMADGKGQYQLKYTEIFDTLIECLLTNQIQIFKVNKNFYSQGLII